MKRGANVRHEPGAFYAELIDGRVRRVPLNGDAAYLRAVEDGDGPTANDEEDFRREYRRQRTVRSVRRELDEEERSSAGDENVFIEVDWKDVKPKDSIPLDEDGVFLVERIHWISGMAGEGKTVLAYWKLVQLAKRRTHSAIYECEMGEELAMGLLRNLGATEHDLKYIHYFRAEAEGTVVNLVAHGRAFCRMLIKREIMALVYDALNPLLVAAEKNENVAADVRAFVSASCQPLAIAGGLVFVLDHIGQVAKDRARGSSDKAAAGHVDLVLKKTDQFARGVSGAIELTCNKDRTGSIVDGSVLTIRVEAGTDGSLRLKPDKWSWELSGAKSKVSSPDLAVSRAAIVKLLRSEGPMTMASIASKLKKEYEAVRSCVRRGLGAKPPVFVQLEDEKIAVIADRSADRTSDS